MAICAGVLAAVPAGAEPWQSRGELALESRAFLPDDDAQTDDVGVGLSGRIEAGWRHEAWRAKGRLFGRGDAVDVERTVLLVEETWIEARAGAFRLRLGADVVNWTATEAFHPADVLNSRNLDSDFEDLEKRGEPMALAAVRLGEGAGLELYALPVFVEPILPSPRSRLNFLRVAGVPLRPDVLALGPDGAASPHQDWVPQGALRYTQTIGGADLALHGIYHVDRSQPLFAFLPAPTAVYQTLAQGGATYVHALGPMLLKGEAAYRHFFAADAAIVGPAQAALDRDHAQIAGALEYGFAHGSGAESALIAEAQGYAGVAAGTPRDSLGVFQRDALIGWRHARNDAQSRELLVTAIVDLEEPDVFMASARYSQRLADTWGIEAVVRAVQTPPRAQARDPLAALREADQARLVLTRYF